MKIFFDVPKTVWLIIFFAFILRVLWLDQNLFFGFEQGRDMQAIKDLVTFQDLKLVGPKTDYDGIFHGVLSYYLLIPFFIIAFGNPYLLTVLLIIIHSFSIILLYKAVNNLFSKNVALISILIYAFSYSSIIYSRWLSNPNLIPALAIVIFYLLTKLKGNPKLILLIALSWGIIFHLSLVSAGLLSLPILVYLIINKSFPSVKYLFLSFGIISLLLSPYVLFEIKSQMLLTKSILKLLNETVNSSGEFYAWSMFTNELVDNVFPPQRLFAILLSLLSFTFILLSKLEIKTKVSILIFLILPIVFLLVLNVKPLRHIYIAIPIFLSIILALGVNFLKDRKLYLLANVFLGIILAGNMWSVVQNLPTSKANFLQHEQKTYFGSEIKLIDYVYFQAKGQEFSYDYYTVPYWKKEGWEYLFNWYGKGKYKYLPSGNRTNEFYVLMEPDQRQEVFQKNWHNGLRKDTEILQIFTAGSLVAEKRIHKK